jgi:hypothetical protein
MSTVLRREAFRWPALARPTALAGLLVLAACGDRPESRAPGDGVAAVIPDTSVQRPATGDTTSPASEPGTSTSSAADSGVTADTPATAAPAGKPAPAAKPVPKPTPRPAARPAEPAPPQPAAQQPPSQPSAQQPAETKAQATTSETPLRDPYHQAPRDTVNQAVYDGWKQYNLNCARCHGEDVLGTTIAPHLITSVKPTGPVNTQELFVQTVCAGRPARGMPAWCPLGLEMEKINQIYSYVKGRSDGKIGPGRPAVRQ